MKLTLCTSAILAALISGSVHATTDDFSFHHEVGASFNSQSDALDDGLWNVGYRYYINAIDTSKGPFALNSFLGQSTNLGASYSSASAIDDIHTYSIDGTYVFDSKWFVGVNYGYVDQQSFSSDSVKLYGFNAGYYLNPTSALWVSYNTIDASPQNESYNSTTFKSTESHDSYGLHARTFIPLPRFSGVDVRASWQYDDNESRSSYASDDTVFNAINNTSNSHRISLDADWYITREWSVGAGYLWNNGESEGEYRSGDQITTFNFDSSNSVYSISTAYWWQISRQFSLQFSASQLFNSDANANDDLYVGIQAQGRI